MPNWCNNSLFVEGDLNELEDFKSKVLIPHEHIKDSMDFTMENLYPTPPELLEMTSPVMWRGEADDAEGKAEFEKMVSELESRYGYTDWYGWRIANWGCKWDANDSYVDEYDSECLGIDYTTAWSPNEGWIKYASEKYPNLKFRLSYEEPGVGFCGLLICEGGEVVSAETGDLEWTDEYGNSVSFDADAERWVKQDGTVIDDADFYPIEYNPYR